MSLRLAIAGVIAIGGSASAAPKARPVAPKLASAVNLENKRPVSLLNFEIVIPAKDAAPEKIVGKLDKPLAAGAAAKFQLRDAKGCLFQARWSYADLKDSGDIDLCSDAHIVLVD